MFIEKLRLTSFKGFEDFELACSPFTVLVGLNSGGKTSVLQAVQLLHQVVQRCFHDQDKPDFANPWWSENPTLSIQRVSPGDFDAIWHNKNLSAPCKISALLTGNIEIRLDVNGRERYQLDILRNGTSLKGQIGADDTRKVIEEIIGLRPTFVPPVGGVAATENYRSYPQVLEELKQGHFLECWRAQLFWLCNEQKTDFDRVIETVHRYLPGADVLLPSLSKDHTARIEIRFKENETTFDISTSGSGLRTILNVAFVLHFAESRCLLFDEPDAHLHGSLQRLIAQMLLDFSAEQSAQVFVTTHAPDFIDEVPTENLIWIDRRSNAGQGCSDLGRWLVDLGAISKSDAIRARGANKILFVEGSLDRNVMALIASQCAKNDPFRDSSVIVAELPDGKSSRAQLCAFQKLLRQTFRVDVRIATVTDNDYEIETAVQQNVGSMGGAAGPLIVNLKRKEIENYLIEPELVAAAAVKVAKERESHTGISSATPTVEQIRGALSGVLQQPEIKDTVKYQLVPRYEKTFPHSDDDATRLRKAEERFDSQWSNMHWQVRNCPGKEVLKRLRTWCQKSFGISLTDRKLIESMADMPSDYAYDIHQAISSIEHLFYDC